MDIKESFCSIYNDHIVREGSQALLSWLLESDFFTAPASTKYHGAHEGVLVEHSLHVYNRLRKMCIRDSVYTRHLLMKEECDMMKFYTAVGQYRLQRDERGRPYPAVIKDRQEFCLSIEEMILDVYKRQVPKQL